jgi:CxxC motif-containing protein (DUF1111 family)
MVAPAQQPATVAQKVTEALTGLDNASNGFVDEATHQADLAVFDEFETIADGLGPLYNAQSCRECHQSPVSGAASQVTELRAGHYAADGSFQNPAIPIAGGAETISTRSLINDRSICPSTDYPAMEIQERVPETETVRTQRLSLNILGDGYVEAVADATLLNLASLQCSATRGRICGQAIRVPIVEAPGTVGVGRFGWKDQHASLMSFAGDAYLNEMGVTSKLFPDEVTQQCNPPGMAEPNDKTGADGLSDVDRFARFMRATKAPPRDAELAATASAQRGSVVFDQVGCSACHVRTLITAPIGTKLNGGTYTVPAALASKQFHPFSDFLLHNIGTGDGIAVAFQEHFGRTLQTLMARAVPGSTFISAQNKIRTAPLWGVRFRARLMHDGASYTFSDAVLRHAGEASVASQRYFQLSPTDRDALLDFLRSL